MAASPAAANNVIEVALHSARSEGWPLKIALFATGHVALMNARITKESIVFESREAHN
jgi:hypothetical protein